MITQDGYWSWKFMESHFIINQLEARKISGKCLEKVLELSSILERPLYLKRPRNSLGNQDGIYLNSI